MAAERIDLKKEQQATLERQRFEYSFLARLFFRTFDLATGRKMTLAKAKLLELMAAVPYRSWEVRQYQELTRSYASEERRHQGLRLTAWARAAQDNEYQHLLLLHEKMGEDRLRDPWFLHPALTAALLFSYRLFAWALAKFSPRRAISFNAEFEDHAERVYAEFVRDHPEWQEMPVTGPLASAYGRFENWADLLRRVSLDERDHRNRSLLFCGRAQEIVRYPGMPEDL